MPILRVKRPFHSKVHTSHDGTESRKDFHVLVKGDDRLHTPNPSSSAAHTYMYTHLQHGSSLLPGR